MKHKFWINQAFFQLAWPACVLGAANEVLWPAAALVAGFLAWQLHPANRHHNDFAVLAVFVAMGVVLDTAWVQAGLVDYATDVPADGMQPAWLAGLWIAMALTVNHSLATFRDRWWLWVLLATFASPLSYTMASRFGAVDWLAAPWLVVLMLGPVWALLTGLVFRWAGRVHARNEKSMSRESTE